TFAGFSMARFSRFPGRGLFGFALMAPLVVPEVILGLSLLLLFVAGESVAGWPQGRGIVTITIAHATFGAGLVAGLVRARFGCCPAPTAGGSLRSDVTLTLPGPAGWAPPSPVLRERGLAFSVRTCSPSPAMRERWDRARKGLVGEG